MTTIRRYIKSAASLIGAAVLFPFAAEADIVSVPEFRLAQTASVWDRLPQSAAGDSIVSLQQAGIERGGAIYRTRVRQALADSTSWIIDRPNGYLLFFVDGEPAAELDSRSGSDRVKLPPMPELAVVEIYADASDKSLSGSKGITGSVRCLTSAGDNVAVTDWRVIPVPMDFGFVDSRAYSDEALPEGPSYYKGSFNLPAGASTYLNLSKWNRGTVWLNGKEVGNFDTSGGVKTLLLTEEVTREGSNDLIVFDLKGPAIPRISCSDREIVSSPKGTSAVRTLDPDMIVAEGKASRGGSPVEITLSFPVSTSYIAVELLGGEGEEVSLAEIKAIGPGINSESRRLWKIDSVSGEESSHPAANAIDSDAATEWRAPASEKSSQWIVINLGTICSITDLILTPAEGKAMPPYRIYAF